MTVWIAERKITVRQGHVGNPDLTFIADARRGLDF